MTKVTRCNSTDSWRLQLSSLWHPVGTAVSDSVVASNAYLFGDLLSLLEPKRVTQVAGLLSLSGNPPVLLHVGALGFMQLRHDIICTYAC